ncbi:MAG: DUF1559 domain-containing protein, partial [Planctomycetaceae bacterium]
VPIDADNDGLLYLNSAQSLIEVPDGASTTILVGEKVSLLSDLGWMNGDESTLRNAGSRLNREYVSTGRYSSFGTYPPGSTDDGPAGDSLPGFGGDHTLVSNFLFADGSVRPISTEISRDILQRLGSRNDGSLMSTTEF